jgi:signal transduction histidine kinase
MTRRITWIILITVWATMIAAGVSAYLTTRAQMLAHLDHVMLDELMADRKYPHRGRIYRTVGRTHRDDETQLNAVPTRKYPHAEPLRKTWFRSPDSSERERSIVAKVWAVPDDAGPDAEAIPIVVPYRRKADEFDPLMNRVAVALVMTTLAGGVIAAVLARVVALTSLRPLRSTAEVIGTIDDRSLDRRIDAARIPPELVPMAEKLNGMLERLETSRQQRQLFLADASHELRTPVAALMSALDLATRRPRDLDYYRQLVADCLVDAKHLRRLVEALMTQIKSERPGHAHDWETVDLRALIDECLTIVAPLAEKRSVQLITPAEPVGAIRTQPTRLRSVLINLMANAIEHNREGGTVEVTFGQCADQVEIAVRDTGPGIAPEHLPHLFEPFYRVDRAHEASEHMGLGLFLVHSHVRDMGGTCTVESAVGVGTTFRVRLPGIAVQQPRHDPVTPPASKPVRV